jgi:hypothetical protein
MRESSRAKSPTTTLGRLLADFPFVLLLLSVVMHRRPSETTTALPSSIFVATRCITSTSDAITLLSCSISSGLF